MNISILHFNLAKQRMAPAWSELGKDFEADPLVKIGRLDCTESESVCRDIEVRGYPTLAYFRDGEVVEPFKGNRVLPELKGFVNSHRKQPESKKALEISILQIVKLAKSWLQQ